MSDESPCYIDERKAIVDRVRVYIGSKKHGKIKEICQKTGLSRKPVSAVVHGAVPLFCTYKRLLALWGESPPAKEPFSPDGNKGENNARWSGGTSEYKDHYQMKINRIEKLKRVRGLCEICGGKATQIHHIDESKENHRIENLLVVCRPCHTAIHRGDRPSRPRVTSNDFGISLGEISRITGLCYRTIKVWSEIKEKREAIEKAIKSNPEEVQGILGPFRWRHAYIIRGGGR